MRVEIVEAEEGPEAVAFFPPREDFVDLRENPQAVGQIPAALHHAPLRNFLTSVNGAESMFATSEASTKTDEPATVSGGTCEFALQTGLVFAAPHFDWDPVHYIELSSSLKELLERDPSDAVRAVLKISPCYFTEEGRRGYCLGIRLVAEGNSAQQAELRLGLALARAQQALLFLSRGLKQHLMK